MAPEKLIALVLAATPDKHAAILRAATADPGKVKLGNIREAAEIGGVNPRTIERYAKKGLLTARRVSPRLVRYDLGEVERLFSQGASTHAATGSLA